MALIIPAYKLILTYNIREERQTAYSQFVIGRFVPGIQELGLHIVAVYQTMYGDYPDRQTEFVAESWEIMRDALENEKFEALERALQDYVMHYSRKVVQYRTGFQF